MQNSLPSFRIDKIDFFKGANAYDDYPDGGVVASTVGMNIFSKPGLLANPPQLGSTVSASLPVNGIISSGIGSGSTQPIVMSVLTDVSDHATFYQVNPATGALTSGGTDSTRSYKLGITDTVFYKGYFYTTSETDICQYTVSDSLVSRVESWWIGSKSQTALTTGIPHPMLVFEDMLYIADGKYLHKNDNGTISTQVFDVKPDHIITALIEYAGLIYVVSEPYKNITGDYHGLAYMVSWDGTSDSWYEEYFIDYRVNALFVYKNVLLMWTNQFLGQWTGSELAPIRPVSNQVFKTHITATADSLVYVDGNKLIRYGTPFIVGNTKRFFNYIQSAANNFAGILSVKKNNMIISEKGGTNSSNYYIDDFNAPGSSGSFTYTFNPRFFKRSVKMRGIVVECDALTSGQSIKAEYIQDNGSTVTPGQDSGVVSATGSVRKQFELSAKAVTRWVKPKITITAGAKLRSVDYSYEASEQPANK